MADAAESFNHVPVLTGAVLEYLLFPTDRPVRLVDGTVGGGGHSALLLERYPRLELLGIDRDDAALTAAAVRLAFAGDRVMLRRGDYADMREIAAACNWREVDGILLDIGVSSPQLDIPGRGFAWRLDPAAPLDMRMDRRGELTAARLLNRADEAELARIFRDFGELKSAKRLAAAVVEKRQSTPFATTGDLVTLCDEVLGRSRPGKLPSPTLVFQALRIAVNDELGQLERGLENAMKLLSPGGRLVVISFHSLEDRLVKNFFRDGAADCICPPGLPECRCNHRATLRQLTHRPVTASPGELRLNPRSAPARLRAAEKLSDSSEKNYQTIGRQK